MQRCSWAAAAAAMYEGDPAVAARHPHATAWQSGFPDAFLASRAAAGDRLAGALSPQVEAWRARAAPLAAAPALHMLFLLPSFINHGAVTNVSTVVIGSTMLVRAARALQPGDELRAAYFDVALPRPQRRVAEAALGFSDAGPRAALEAAPEVAALHAEIHAAYESLADGCLSPEVRARAGTCILLFRRSWAPLPKPHCPCCSGVAAMPPRPESEKAACRRT